MNINKDKTIHWLSYVVYLLLIAFVFRNGIHTTGDSASYIGMSSIRSPMYPALIKLFYFIGGNHYQIWLLCFQILFGTFGIFVFSRFLHQFFKLNDFLTFVLTLFLSIPYFFYGKIANLVMTEAIAYPLFLISVRFLIESVFDKRMRPFVIYMICSVPLVLTRGQFLFFYVISLVILMIFLIFLKEKRRKIYRLIAIFILLVISTNLIERTYSYFLFNKFDKVNLSGVQLSAAAFYLSSVEDVRIFTDSTEIKFFKGVQDITHKQNSWNLAYAKTTEGNNGLGYYQMTYNKIIWQAVFPEAVKCVPHLEATNDMSGWIYVNKLTKSVSFKLIKQHWKEFSSLIAMNVLFGLGYKYFAFIFLLFLVISVVFSIKYKNNFSILYSLLLMIGLLNVLLVSMLEPASEQRYFIYNYALYITLIIITINNWANSIETTRLKNEHHNIEQK